MTANKFLRCLKLVSKQKQLIFNDVNPINNSNFDRNSMPLLHKILLCTILLCNKETKVKETLLSKVFKLFLSLKFSLKFCF